VTRGLISAAVIALVLAGCGDSSSDKAGGSDREATVLKMANGNDEPWELQAFADEVAERSDGALRIEFASHWREDQRDYEAGLIRDVRTGRVALGVVGSRAWRAIGVKTFGALHAPFLIDSYALQRDVLDSRIPEEMLEGLTAHGLVGIGVLPGPLFRPLSAKRALRNPTDFAGLRVGYQGATEPADSLRALGATPVQIPAGADWRGIDAIAQHLASINLSGYDAVAKHLTANVALWPRANVLFMSKRAYASISPSQRALLHEAADSATPAALANVRAREREALAALCRRGIDLVTASPADIGRLRAATAPVLDALRRSLQTRGSMAAIETMRERGEARAEPAPSCPGQGRPSAGGIPDGSYTTTITREDIRRARLTPDYKNAVEPQSQFELVINAGTFVLYETRPGARRALGLEGMYSLFRDRFVGTASDGEVLRARWSFDGTDLTFTEFEPKRSAYSLTWASRPWRRRAP